MATNTITTGVAGQGTRWRFVIAICLGSFLLFLVQPLVARMALPRLGGAPSVWNSAMLVYQGLLLAGYAYAHWLSRFDARTQSRVHLGLFALAALTLPIGLSASNPSATANPFFWVPWLLLTSIGPLFFVISAQAPLMQRWFSYTSSEDPYPLYAASNLGSFGGLLAYPLLVEPLLPIAQQRWLWSAGYILLAGAVIWCALALPRRVAVVEARAAGEPISAKSAGRWILLSAVPSGLILSTTLHLTTDIGAMPLLWVIPLGVYLLSFTVAFAENRRPARLISKAAPFILLVSACSLYFDGRSEAILFAVIVVINLFTVAVSLHSRLFDSRPDASRLTFFYFVMSFGGFLGGVFCALVAPLIFDWTYEHPILLAAAAILMPLANPFERLTRKWRGPALSNWLPWVAVAALGLIAAWASGMLGLERPESPAGVMLVAFVVIGIFSIGRRLLFVASLIAILVCAGGWESLQQSAEPGRMSRSYFGIYTVRELPDDARALIHGTTIHGVQLRGSPARERTSTSYYAPASGVGLAMAAVPEMWGADARVSIVGLGAGTLACYARPGQSWTFYEIDPLVAEIAQDDRRFSFLSRCAPNPRIVLGDARLTLQAAPASSADLLVIDAFSSDSIPVHLLTREALTVYRRHIGPDGLLMIHISNRYLDLAPLVSALAADGGWHGRIRMFVPDAAQRKDTFTPSLWVALSPSPTTISKLDRLAPKSWTKLPSDRGLAPWTDDYASLLPVIDW